MENKKQLRGQLRKYLQWPMLIVCLQALLCVVLYILNKEASFVAAIFFLVDLAIALVLFFYNRPRVLHELTQFAMQFGEIQKDLLQEFEAPYALLSMEGNFIWLNKAFSDLIEKDEKYHKSVFNTFPDITPEMLPQDDKGSQIELTYEGRDFKIVMRRIELEEYYRENSAMELDFDQTHILTMYLFDETQTNRYIRQIRDEKLVTGLIYIDNFEEAQESTESVRRPLLVALIDRKINQYFSNCDGLVKKLEKDKYFLVMRNSALEQLREVKFNILDEVKTISIGNEMRFTISIGIGLNAQSYAHNAESARIAIELALGRGGDQVVIKDGEKITYYGGKTQSVESNNRVKARIKAQALKESLSSCDRIVVMGHQITDVDTFGAAIGIYRAGKTIGKKVHIVIENPTVSIRPLMEMFLNNADYDAHMFVNHHEAKELVDRSTAVVVVDTNKPSYTECPELLDKTNTLIVLDHHRQGSEVIRGAVLSYIEPYASSACEMVAEVLQYFDDEIRIRNIEADSMYAGVMIDTNNFMAKTGVRTFEAAAFLRRCGADVTRVRKLFRNSMTDYKARAETIRQSQLYLGVHAIAVCPSEGLESPTIVCAQAANELLNIEGIRASYVLTDYKGVIHISARAIDEINVQLIMERLGGGGHMNIAGAQLAGTTMEDAIDLLKTTIKQMTDEGDI